MRSIYSRLLLTAAIMIPVSAFAQQAGTSDSDRQLAKARSQGAAEQDIQAFLANRDPEVRPFYQALFVEGERNAVLNFDRVGLIELERHNVKLAALLFDHAADRIDAIYANDPNAEKARSLWSAESVKDFKGEPYERAMTFYYRGVARLMMADYENARANFKHAEEQTLLSEAEKYEKTSFSALTYLSGWASHCAGDERSAKEFFDAAISNNAALKAPAATDNLLLIGEIGSGPTKSTQGKYNEQLKMVAGARGGDPTFAFSSGQVMNAASTGAAGNAVSGAAAPIPASLGATTLQGVLASDISEQSMMRDGRPVDVILKGKAKFKDGASTASQVGVVAGTTLMEQGVATNNNNMAGLGAGFALFGMIAAVAAEAATPAADSRYWDTLPNGLELATANSSVANTAVKWSSGGAAQSDMFVQSGQACSVAWAREKSALNGPASGPNANPTLRLDSKHLAKDATFRAMLLTDFSQPPAASPAPASPLIPINASVPAAP